MGRLDVGVRGGHGRSVEPIDRDDPAADLDVARRGDDVADLLEALEGTTGQPDRRVAQLRQLACGTEEDVAVRGGHRDADWAQLQLGHVKITSPGARRG